MVSLKSGVYRPTTVPEETDKQKKKKKKKKKSQM